MKEKEKTPKLNYANLLKRVRKPKEDKKQENDVAIQKVKMLITIVDRRKADFYVDFLQSEMHANVQMSTLARGTADSETLRLLGLEENDKTVIFSLINEIYAQDALVALEEKFKTIRHGKGVAFTVPLSSVSGVALYRFLSDNRIERREVKK